MNKKLYVLPVIAMLLFFLSAIAFVKTAEAAEKEIIASGACGELHYDYESEDSDFYVFEADESVQYKLYKNGTMIIYGSGVMGDFNTWTYEDDMWYNRRKELIPWYDYRTKIRKLVVEEGVETIGSASFYGCKNLESIQWGDSIKSVRDYSFYGCKKLKSIPWTKGIKGVGDSAFKKCSSLKEVRLPSHVKNWGDDVFAECTGLKNVSVDRNFQFSVRYTDTKWGSWEDIERAEGFPRIIRECQCNGMFRGCISLEEVKLPKNLPAIPSRFVEGCSSLKTFPIPDNLTYWGSCPPSLCKGKYVLPDSVRTLGDGAFAGCRDLEELVLPKGLVYMDKAFLGCSSLKTMKIPKSVRELNQTFYNCTGLENIVIPDTVQKGLESEYLDVNDGVGVFEGCSNLKSVVLPGNMKYIGNSLFKDCTSLKKIKLPSKLKKIEDNAFEGCSSLTDIKISKTVKDIGSYAFSGCTSLEEIDLPKGVEILYDELFYNCKNLKRVTVRAKKVDFGEKVFCGCKKLSQITLYAKDLGSWTDELAFDGIPKGVTIFVPKGCVNKFKKQFRKAKIDLSNIDIKPMK